MALTGPLPYLLTLLLILTQKATAQVFNCNGGTLSIVAHADDDLLFQTPYIFNPLSANCFPAVFVTGGDAGHGLQYAIDRERGNEAAKAAYLGVANSWSESTATFAGQTVTVRTLTARPGVQNIYFRLPDGNVDGSGFSWDSYPSLLNLYAGYVGSLTSLDGKATVTLDSLRQALGSIISQFGALNVITQDYLSDLGSGDHSDHLVVARIVAGLVGTYAPSASLSGFMGYPASAFPPTGSQDDPAYQAKADMFFQYTPYDFLECQSYSACADAGRAETSWLLREYVVDSQLAQTYVRTIPPTVDFSKDLALLGSASASSFASGQPPSAAINGIIGGYTADGLGNDADEWSSNRQGQGAYWQVTWDFPVSVTDIILYDRPNFDDQITSGSITLDDGHTLSFGYLPNNGSGYAIPVGNVTTTSVFVRVGSVGYRTVNAGLSEVVVLGSVLDASGNDTTPTPGPGDGTSFAWSNDIALFASASASSSAPDQGASKAIDGQLGGYDGLGGDYTQEWSSNGEGVGASLLLSWSRPVEIYRVLAYDRPNTDDQVTSATIAFGDGTRVQVGQLAQDGSATSIALPNNITTTTLRFTVTGVAPSTKNVGLRELVVLGAYAASADTNNGTNSTTPPPVNGWSNDLALQAMATASSYDPASPPSGAVDAIIGGYLPEGGEDHAEWSSWGEKAGAWINLQWANPVAVSTVVLYDRINLDDQVTSGVLSFDDGSTVSVGQLPNDGAGVTISLGNKTVQNLRFTVNSVSASTINVGLAEIAVFGSGLSTPINGTDGAGTPIGGGGSGGNTTLPVPGGNGTTNGTLPGSGDLPSPASGNVALLAVASASSSSPDQGPEKARDGVLDGYTDQGGDWTKEWASNGQGAGAWIQYDWADGPVTISSLEISDRPNPNDQVMAGTITFSDGSAQSVGALPNDGAALSVSTSKEAITWLRFTIDSLSWSTINVGLAELAVFGYATNSTASRRIAAPVINATETTSILANDTMPTTSANITLPTGNATATLDSMPTITSANYTSVALNISSSINATATVTSTLLSNITVEPTAFANYTTLALNSSSSMNVTATMTSTLPSNITAEPTTMSNSSAIATLSFNVSATATTSGSPASNASTIALNATGAATGSLNSTSLQTANSTSLPQSTILSFTNVTSGPTTSAMPNATATSSVFLTDSMLSTSDTSSISSTRSTSDTFSTSSISGTSNLPTTSNTSSTPSTPSTSSTPSTPSTSSTFSTSSTSSTPSTSSTSSTSSTFSTFSTSSMFNTSSTSSRSSTSSTFSTSSTSTSSRISSSSTSSRSATTSRTSSSASTSKTASSSQSSTSTAALPAQTVEIAGSSTCRASSNGAGTSCTNAIDGKISQGSEWVAGSGKGVGSWLQIDFPARSTVYSIRLFDRQGTASGIQTGMLSFSDGSEVPVGPISKTGTRVSLSKSGKASTFVRFTVLSVESGSDTVGLAEIEVYGSETQGSDRRRHVSRSRSQVSPQKH